MSNQFFEGQPAEMGLFTFYKKQQDEDETLHQKHKGKRGKKKKGSRSKKKMHSLKKPSPDKPETSIDTLNNSDSCDEFLKSIRPKLKKLELAEVSEQIVNEHLEDKPETIVIQSHSHQPIKTEPKTYVYKMILPKVEKLSDSPSNKLSASLFTTDFTRNQPFPRQRNSLKSPAVKKMGNRELVKQRIRTQIDHQLHKNHMDYIHSAQRELIVGHKVPSHMSANRESLPLPTPAKNKSNTLSSNKPPRVTEGESPIRTAANMGGQLHEANKRYINNLVQHLSVRPEYNQTVYRILRETLKFPQLARSTHRHIKTETSSPVKQQQLMQVRSHSYYKKVGPQTVKEEDRTRKRMLKAVVVGNK